jgi:hypothetical protein
MRQRLIDAAGHQIATSDSFFAERLDTVTLRCSCGLARPDNRPRCSFSVQSVPDDRAEKTKDVSDHSRDHD